MEESSEPFDSRSFLSQLTTQPGVYRMVGGGGELLYVGKARNLKKRVGSYFLRASGDPRIESMVSQIHRVEVTVTHTEDEALLKVKLLNAHYPSQAGRDWWDDDLFLGLMRVRGMESRSRYAEGFYAPKVLVELAPTQEVHVR